MNKSVIVFITLFPLLSCKESDEFQYIAVRTDKIEENSNKVIFYGRIYNSSNISITESGFILSMKRGDDSGATIKYTGVPVGIFSVENNLPLLPAKTYYVRSYVKTENLTIYGSELSFVSGGEVNKGSWSEVVQNAHYGWCEFIRSSFSINDKTYFLFEKGYIYSYNHVTNTFDFIKASDIIKYADYAVVYKNEAYIFSLNSFNRFNPIDLSLTRLSEWPAGDRHWITGFIIGDNAFVGLGQINNNYRKDFWKYNIPTNRWESITDFPGEFRSRAYSFSIDSIAFIGGGYNLIWGQFPYPKFNDLWMYVPEENNWNERTSLPFENEELYDLLGTVNKGKGYCFYKKKFYEYLPSFNYWEPMADLSNSEQICYPHLFSHNERIYVVWIKNNNNELHLNMWRYEK
jgi:hypothetical protein